MRQIISCDKGNVLVTMDYVRRAMVMLLVFRELCKCPDGLRWKRDLKVCDFSSTCTIP